MKKRFIVLINNTTAEENVKFLEFIKEKGFGWWRHLNNSWLLITFDEYVASDIRDIIKTIYKGENNLVIEIREDGSHTWAGFGPGEGKKNMFKWLKESWENND